MVRKEKIFKIPVESVKRSIHYWAVTSISREDKLHEYCSDKYNVQRIENDLLEFINGTLKDYNLKLSESVKGFIKETVSNAYDSFSKLDLNSEKSLILKIVITNEKDSCRDVIIKIMDNGSGFLDKSKSKYFFLSDTQPEKKDPRNYIGGAQIGLRNLNESVLRMGGTLFFKNRKDIGASVYM